MNVLIACEFSGTVRDAFKNKGHYALSCDILPREQPGWHYQGDIMDIINDGWDLMIAHPPCTYLTNSGVRWLYEKPGRWELMYQAADFFKALLSADIEKVCVENPIPHGHAELPKYNQTIQPWQFGHTETKRTCLWLKNLPELKETNNVKEQMKGMSKTETDKIHRMAPSKDRSKLRSVTYQGIADAMAEQWG